MFSPALRPDPDYAAPRKHKEMTLKGEFRSVKAEKNFTVWMFHQIY
jgi:hypothetical protein